MLNESLLKSRSGAGVGSRRKLAEAIKQGRVAVNGHIATDFRLPLDPANDLVTLDGRPVDLRPGKMVYLMLNKPAGVLATTRDERGRGTVIGLLPPKYRRLGLYPAGRLDKDSTGLLLLTNDGALTYRLTHPRFEHEKEYLVRLDKRLEPSAAGKLRQGIELEDGRTRPAAVRSVATEPFSYRVTVHEGKKRQLRRMFASLGYRVAALQRVRIGSLVLSSLKEGEARELTAPEVRELLGKPL
ncbi:MAG: pseudouridine synthase [Chloroflexota bacterium]